MYDVVMVQIYLNVDLDSQIFKKLKQRIPCGTKIVIKLSDDEIFPGSQQRVG
jgi:hypothetical protein